MNISLRPELEKFVQDKVRAGDYAEPSAVINDALEILREQEALSPADVEELRREIQIGIDEADRGESRPWDPDKIKAEGRARKAE